MSKTEIIIFAILAVISAMTAFDWITFVVKSAPKQAYFTKRIWLLGILTTIALVYWYMNGMKFH
jgi:hypothetical protein